MKKHLWRLLKLFIPEGLYKKLLFSRSILKEIYLYKKKNNSPVFLIMTPEYDNLGDHAITLAEKYMLEKINIVCYEITYTVIQQLIFYKRINVLNKSIILVNGGGYLGTLLYKEELKIRTIVKACPDSKIILFPNTIYYNNTQEDIELLEESKKIYNKHKYLIFYAREKYSYDIMKNVYLNVNIAPDMVLSLDKSRIDTIRRGCIICLRSDCEKTRTKEEESEVFLQVRELFGDNYLVTDMCVDAFIPASERNKYLDKKFYEFETAQLVITDRLHGMIFSAITGTPCIVINSKSHKLIGTYDWIKNLNYIKFAKNACQISELYREIPKCKHLYSNSELQPYYKKLEDTILSTVREF